jgi:alkylation response protein AidB-like acyl-CoA dehydrogenase
VPEIPGQRRWAPSASATTWFCASIEHKIGIHGSATAVMSFGEGAGAIGWLVGEANQGLTCMFTMMNHARLNVGLDGVAISTSSEQSASPRSTMRCTHADLDAAGDSGAPRDALQSGIATALRGGIKSLTEATDWVLAAPAREAAAGAVPYLKLAGTVIAGWLMAQAARAATAQRAAARWRAARHGVAWRKHHIGPYRRPVLTTSNWLDAHE